MDTIARVQAKCSKASRRVTGFTLIEVLVALVLLAMLSLLAWRAVDGMARSGELTTTHEQNLQRVQAGLAQWTADWDAIAASGFIPPIEFDGATLRLTRYSGESTTTPANGGIVVVAWALQNQQEKRVWRRWVSPGVTTRAALQAAWDEAGRWARTPLPQDDVRTVSLIPLESWQLFYFRGNAWSNALSAADAPAAAGSPMAMQVPDGVRLVINQGQQGGGTLTKLWLAPWQGATR